MKNITGQSNPTKTTMTDDLLKELKKKVYDSLSMDRQKLLIRQPFIGGMLMRMDFIPIRDYRCNTAQTDGSRIFFDIDFYKNLTEDQRKFVLAHEVWHVVYMHFLRKQNRDAKLWNIATDCEINYMLKNEGFNAPEDLCFPDKDDEGKSAEEIYESILKKAKKSKYSCSDKQEGTNKKDKSSSRYGNNKKAKNNGKLDGQFDKHVGSEDEDTDNGNITSHQSDEWGEKGEDPDYTPRIDQDAAEKIREMIISEAQRCERSQGKLPGNLESVINNLRNPEISWREYLCQFTTKCMGDKRVWLPPNRHHVWCGNYFQSRRSEKISAIVTVDTSGSTINDLPKFMTELISLMNTFGRYELTIVQCDSDVNDITTYDENNEFPVNNPELVKWKGFGGSDLRPAFREILKNCIEGSFHIIFTDGYIEFPSENELGIPTLVVLTKDGNENCCGEWAEKVVFKNEH